MELETEHDCLILFVADRGDQLSSWTTVMLSNFEDKRTDHEKAMTLPHLDVTDMRDLTQDENDPDYPFRDVSQARSDDIFSDHRIRHSHPTVCSLKKLERLSPTVSARLSGSFIATPHGRSRPENFPHRLLRALNFPALTRLDFTGLETAASFVLAFEESRALAHVTMELWEDPPFINHAHPDNRCDVVVKLVGQHRGHLRKVEVTGKLLPPGWFTWEHVMMVCEEADVKLIFV